MPPRDAPPQPSLFDRTPSEIERPVLSVAELDRKLKHLLERVTDGVRALGEVTGLKEHASGHAYFTLRDEHEDAAVECVMYRSAPVRARRLLADGARLVLRGRVTFWAPRGRVQFVVEGAELSGRGALLEALERLKKKLLAEGLFARERKRALPSAPRVIGVVTSKQGAVLSDIVKVAFRRGAVRIVVAPTAVQGEGAARSIGRALVALARHPEVEAIIVGRGGGSVDDLAAFNDEALVRLVAACPVPVVSAVGHETDTSLVDLAADVRASTPSQAAELLIPDQRFAQQRLRELQARLLRVGRRMIEERQQRLDEFDRELRTGAARAFTRDGAALRALERRLRARHPASVLAAARADLAPLERRMVQLIQRGLERRRQRLVSAAARLESLSPLAVLGRGYALVARANGALVRSVGDLAPEEPLTVRVADGRFSVLVSKADAGSEER